MGSARGSGISTPSKQYNFAPNFKIKELNLHSLKR
jgi:hypothetical protein